VKEIETQQMKSQLREILVMKKLFSFQWPEEEWWGLEEQE
jgi:hypothetical protein